MWCLVQGAPCAMFCYLRPFIASQGLYIDTDEYSDTATSCDSQRNITPALDTPVRLRDKVYGGVCRLHKPCHLLVNCHYKLNPKLLLCTYVFSCNRSVTAQELEANPQNRGRNKSLITPLWLWPLLTVTLMMPYQLKKDVHLGHADVLSAPPPCPENSGVQISCFTGLSLCKSVQSVLHLISWNGRDGRDHSWASIYSGQWALTCFCSFSVSFMLSLALAPPSDFFCFFPPCFTLWTLMNFFFQYPVWDHDTGMSILQHHHYKWCGVCTSRQLRIWFEMEGILIMLSLSQYLRN